MYALRAVALSVIAAATVQVTGAGAGWAQEEVGIGDFDCAIAYAVLGMGRPDVSEVVMPLAAEALNREFEADGTATAQELSERAEAEAIERFTRVMEGEEDVQLVVDDVEACNARYGV